MRWKLSLIVGVFLTLLTHPASAVNKEDFLVKTTEDLVDLCTVSGQDELEEEAIHFCHGYLVGAYHYYRASTAGPEAEQLICLPEPPPSREATISMFIDWAKDHPQYMDELPVETEFRFLTETWPCK